MNCILNKQIKYYTKQTLKISRIIGIALLIIIALILIKYKPVYKVTISGEEIGYVENKTKIEECTSQLLENKEEGVAFVTLKEEPNYELSFVSNVDSTDEEVVLGKIQENIITTYVRYAIYLDNEVKGYSKTEEEAKIAVENIKQEYGNKLEINLSVVTEYTENLNELIDSNVELAKNDISTELKEIIKEEEKKKNSTVNGVYLAVKPVTGRISSRFGATNGRDHSHKGIDIAASTGTPIYAVAEGTVTRAGWANGYGNLVVISHGNGIETYYGHCSKLYVKTGQKVEAGDHIASVGSTGRSTGPHLHLEIRKNGTQLNPQKYVYK